MAYKINTHTHKVGKYISEKNESHFFQKIKKKTSKNTIVFQVHVLPFTKIVSKQSNSGCSL